MTKFFNPLKEIAKETQLKSESSSKGRSVVNNENYGKCSICQAPMSIVKNAEGANVFWCETHKVTLPCKEQ